MYKNAEEKKNLPSDNTISTIEYFRKLYFHIIPSNIFSKSFFNMFKNKSKCMFSTYIAAFFNNSATVLKQP